MCDFRISGRASQSAHPRKQGRMPLFRNAHDRTPFRMAHLERHYMRIRTSCHTSRHTNLSKTHFSNRKNPTLEMFGRCSLGSHLHLKIHFEIHFLRRSFRRNISVARGPLGEPANIMVFVQDICWAFHISAREVRQESWRSSNFPARGAHRDRLFFALVQISLEFLCFAA